MPEPQSPTTELSEQEERRREWRMFLFIIVFLFPLLTFMLVATLGFSIWMFQLVMGPPGVG
jgi:periplasmic nitrate reductase NapE